MSLCKNTICPVQLVTSSNAVKYTVCSTQNAVMYSVSLSSAPYEWKMLWLLPLLVSCQWSHNTWYSQNHSFQTLVCHGAAVDIWMKVTKSINQLWWALALHTTHSDTVLIQMLKELSSFKLGGHNYRRYIIRAVHNASNAVSTNEQPVWTWCVMLTHQSSVSYEGLFL